MAAPVTSSQIPTDSVSSALQPCFYTVRQLLPTKLNILAQTQLPPQHPCIEYIASVQKILHHLLETRGLIAAFFLAGNEYNPTYTNLDRHWHHIDKYEKMWAGVEGVLQACLDGAFGRSSSSSRREEELIIGQQQQQQQQHCRGADFIQDDEGRRKCPEGIDFLKRLCTGDKDDLFNEIEEYCEEVEQDCVMARANLE